MREKQNAKAVEAASAISGDQETRLRRYRMLIAHDIPCYGEIEFTAESDEVAARVAERMLDNWDKELGPVELKPEWEGATEHRAVYVRNEESKELVVEDLYCVKPQTPKVLISVHKGVGDYVTQGDVDVILVDEDNIDAGDPSVLLDESWRQLVRGVYDESSSRYVKFGSEALD
jgi:hypothetical protein